MEEKAKGSVYQQWHAALLDSYIDILKMEVKRLKKLPSSEFSVPDGDVDDLLELANFFDVDIPQEEEASLKDISVFKKYLGKIRKKAKKVVLHDLRPMDPYAQVIYELKEEDVRFLEGEKA